jgi:hypothetical protein
MIQERRVSDIEYKNEMTVRVLRIEEDLAEVKARLAEVLDLLRASKMGMAALKGVILLGVAVAGAVAAFKGIR